MVKAFKSISKFNWFLLFLLFFFISEASYKWFLWEGYRHVRIAAVVKIIAQAIMLLVIIVHRRKVMHYLLVLILLLFFFTIGQLSLETQGFSWYNLEYFNISIYSFLLFLFFYCAEPNNDQISKGLKLYEIIISINAVLAIVGFLFSIRYFETYRGTRFGYDGLLMKSSYSSYFNLIALFYSYHKYFILRRLHVGVLVLVIAASLLSGTKASWLGLVLVSFYFVYRTKALSLRVISMSLIALLLLFVASWDYLLSILYKVLPVHAEVIEEYGFITGLLSFRNLILVENLLPFIGKKWTFVNYLFGGMGDIMLKSGIDPIDLFYFFGLIGSIIYIYLFKSLFFNNHYQKDLVVFMIFVVIISIFAGNFFYNSSLGIMLCTLKFYFQQQHEQ